MQPYLGLHDLFRRWPLYTARGIRKMVAKPDFPAPKYAINAGHDPVWFVPDIEGYERPRPWLRDLAAKRRRVAGYAIALARGRGDRAQEEASL